MHSLKISVILLIYRLLPACTVQISPPVLPAMVLNFQLLLLVMVLIILITFRLGFLSISFLENPLPMVPVSLFLMLVLSSMIVSGLGFRKKLLVNSSLLRVWEQLLS